MTLLFYPQPHLFRNSVDHGLQMCSRYHREDPGVHHSQVLRAIHSKMRIHYSTLLQWKHSASTAWMKFGPYTSVDYPVECSLIIVDRRNELCSLQWQHGRCRKNLSIEEQCLNENLSVDWVRQPSRIDVGRFERVGGANVALASREGMHNCEGQTPSVVVDDLIGSHIRFGQSTDQGLFLEGVACDKRRIKPCCEKLGWILVVRSAEDAR